MFLVVWLFGCLFFIGVKLFAFVVWARTLLGFRYLRSTNSGFNQIFCFGVDIYFAFVFLSLKQCQIISCTDSCTTTIDKEGDEYVFLSLFCFLSSPSWNVILSQWIVPTCLDVKFSIDISGSCRRRCRGSSQAPSAVV